MSVPLSSSHSSSSSHNNETDEKAALLKERVSDAITYMRQNKRDNRRRASLIRVTSILLSGIMTVLLGLQIVDLADTFRNIAFVFGATVTILNALEPFFNYRALWIEHEIALAEMHRLQDQVDYYLAGVAPESIEVTRLNEFAEKYNEIWNGLNQAWISHRKSERSASS
ncbi:MAG: DUF4231 domain-containing protein [Anaerolineae bacterium]|nr:DUF4231 domain-containing protein [Anaerolineae bacterium]